jgi:antitoxin YefM
MQQKIIPVTEFRGKVLETVRQAQSTGQEYVITTRGKPAAVLIGFDEWEALIETKEIKANKQLMRQIEKSRKYFSKGGKGKLHHEIDWS